MKKTIQKLISVSLVSYIFLGITAKQALANRDNNSLETAVQMAQFRFGQKTRVGIGLSIPKEVYAEDILIICNALDTGNSLQEISEILIHNYVKAFKNYSLAVHYFESVAKHGTMYYCSEHMSQTFNIGF